MTGPARGSRLSRRHRVFEPTPHARTVAPVQALRHLHERYANLLRHSRDIIVRLDRSYRICDASPGLAALVPHAVGSLVGRRLTDLGLKPERLGWWRQRLDEVFETGEVLDQNGDYHTSDGTMVLDWKLLPERGLDGAVVSVLAIVGDVTSRRKAEQSYQQLFDQSTVGVALHDVVCDASGRPVDYGFLAVNRTFERIMGLSSAQVEGRRVTELFPGIGAAWIERLGNVALTGEPVSFEDYFEGLDRYLELTAYRAGDRMFACMFSDITERKRAEQRLAESEERYRTVFGAASDAMFLLDAATGRILDANSAAERIYGYTHEEFLARRNVDMSAEPDKTYSAMKRRTGHTPLRRHRKKDGTVFPVEITANYYDERGRSVSVVSVRDITARVQAEVGEEQLRNAQRMQAVGQLAGGVAQDFHNLLSTIANHAGFLAAMAPESAQSNDDLNEIRLAAYKALSLTDQLVAFSKQQEVSPNVIDVNDAIANLGQLLARVLGGAVRLDLDLRDGAGTVFIDRRQLSQIIVNLCVHAKSCMTAGGALTVRTGTCAAATLPSSQPPAPSSHVLIELSHTGAGMSAPPMLSDPSILRDDPLSAVFGIVERCGGRVEVQPESGMGATFRVVLPRAGFDDPSALPSESVRDGGGQLVLLVEDEDAIRRNTARMLIQGGFRVVEASNAQDALVRLLDTREPFALVLSDVVMPGLSGVALAEFVAVSHPGIKLLFMSGYPEDLQALPLSLNPEQHVLAKPFGRSELLGMVAGLLGN